MDKTCRIAFGNRIMPVLKLIWIHIFLVSDLIIVQTDESCNWVHIFIIFKAVASNENWQV